jgi:pimeloyl-ACP methyl ester carboxylesterase
VSNIVLVHGGFVDGSGWEPVYRILRDAGHQVDVVQNPTKSLADDVAVTSRVLDQREDVILVGHSYGGAVITEAGNHQNVKALVYIAAFAPDSGESVNTLIADPPPGAPVPPILPPSTASSSSIAPPSRPTSSLTSPSSWPTHRSPGASTRSAA